MKKVIFLLLILSPIILDSCSNEIAVFPEVQVEDVTFTTSFDVKGVDTKSGVVEADEKKVSNITVFVFRDAPAPNDTLVREATKIDVTSMPVSSQIKAKSGKVKIVALANVGEISAGTYRDLQAKTVQYASATEFVSASLPKFACKDATLAVTIENGEQVVPEMSMTLVQLAARVDVSVALDDISKNTHKFTPQTAWITHVNGSSALVLSEYVQGSYTYNIPYNKLGVFSQEYGDNSFYTFETNQSIRLEVSGTLVDTRNNSSTTKKYGLDIVPKFGGESKTDGFIHGFWYTVKGIITPANETIAVTISVKPWEVQSVDDVEFGGSNSDNNNRK